MSLVDTFAGRTVGSGWGTASDGNVWTQQRAGTNQVLSVGSNEGKDLPSSTGGTAERQTLGSAQPSDVEILLRWQAQNSGDNMGVFARWQDTNNFYHYGFDTGPILELSKSVAGSFSTFATVSISGTWVAGTFYWFRVRVQGPRHQLRWWQDGTAEPTSWNLDANDTSFPNGGLCGISIRGASVATSQVDSFSVFGIASDFGPRPRRRAQWRRIWVARASGSLPTGNTFQQSLTAGLSFTGSGPKNAITKGMTGGLSFTGSGPKNAITKGLTAAALSFSGALTRATSTHLVAAVLSFSGAQLRSMGTHLTGGLSFVGALPSRAITKMMTAGLSFAGAQTRAMATHLSGGLSFIGNLTRATSTHLSAALSFAGNLLAGRSLHQTLTATLSFAGNLVSGKFLHQSLTAALSFTGAIPSRAIGKVMSGALSFAGSGPVRAITKAMTASLSFTGAQRRAIGTHLTGGLSFSGTVARRIPKVFTAALSFAGSVTGQSFHLPPVLEKLFLMGQRVIMSLLGLPVSSSQSGASGNLPMKGTNTDVKMTGGKAGIQD